MCIREVTIPPIKIKTISTPTIPATPTPKFATRITSRSTILLQMSLLQADVDQIDNYNTGKMLHVPNFQGTNTQQRNH